jgi:hypothetical protein
MPAEVLTKSGSLKSGSCLPSQATGGYTLGMKTAISIPNEVFRNAESLAQQLKVSRSQLYSRAITEYVARHASDSVTESLDRLFADLDERRPDPLVSAAARRILERTEW